VQFLERFGATLQAPKFDFRRLPFDTPEFFIKVNSIYPESYFSYVLQHNFSEVGKKPGKEQWVVDNFDTSIGSTRELYGRSTSQFVFNFWARRHLNYYMFRLHKRAQLAVLLQIPKDTHSVLL
jgi:hypothetical protein